jgi:hypothetical protein
MCLWFWSWVWAWFMKEVLSLARAGVEPTTVVGEDVVWISLSYYLIELVVILE